MRPEDATEPAVGSLLDRGVGRPVPKRKRLTPRQKRMQRAISFLRDYMNTYEQQSCCLDYTDAIFIDDVLCGLGVALHGDECSFAKGYEAWKARLREHLKTPNVRAEARP